MARLVKTEVKPNVSMVSNFIHDDDSIEQVKCKVGDKVTVKYVKDHEVKEITGVIEKIYCGKADFHKGDLIELYNVPFYKTSQTNSVSFRRNGTFYVWADGEENNRIRVTNLKSNVGKANCASGWVDINDIFEGIGYNFDNEIKPTFLFIDASEEYKSNVVYVFAREIVELTVVEEVTKEVEEKPITE